MSMNVQLAEKLSKIIDDAQILMQEAGWDGRRFPEWKLAREMLNHHEYMRVKTRLFNFVQRLCGLDGFHYTQLTNHTLNERHDVLAHYVAVARAIREDLLDGLLSINLRAEITSDIFDDLLTQARDLIADGHFVPAASLAGAILENALRHLCSINSIDLPDTPGLAALNELLSKEGLYGDDVRRQIQEYASVRNCAAHGDFESVDADQVKSMIDWVATFIRDYVR